MLPSTVTFFVQAVPSPEIEDLLEGLLAYSKFGNIPPSDYWQMTYSDRIIISKKLNEWQKEEAKAKGKRDENFLRALGKMLHGMFSKR